MLGGCPVLGGGPGPGVGGPLRLLLPGVRVPDMPAASQSLKEPSAARSPRGRRTEQTDRAPPLTSGAGATPPRPRANQLPAGGRPGMTYIRARRGALLSAFLSWLRPTSVLTAESHWVCSRDSVRLLSELAGVWVPGSPALPRGWLCAASLASHGVHSRPGGDRYVTQHVLYWNRGS